MRILQMIDSLEVGGAERMAVNYANALSKKTAFSGLAATRKEGSLKNQLDARAHYFFLGKKGTFDFAAIFRLRSYCSKNHVEIVHAHSSSFFTAFLLKLAYPKIRIIWHDHYGLSEFLHSRPKMALKAASVFFDGIITVNRQLQNWALSELYCNKVAYLPNFTEFPESLSVATQLKGIAGKRILCLANLRPQKNHFLLIEVAKEIAVLHPQWTFHLVGKDFDDDYSAAIKALILSEQLSENVFVYGSKNDTSNIIRQSDIAVLTSDSEGLPVALLEYGLHKKAVVVTEVGEIPLIVKSGFNGLLADVRNVAMFSEQLSALINSQQLRKAFGEALYETVMQNHSESAVIGQYLDWINKK